MSCLGERELGPVYLSLAKNTAGYSDLKKSWNLERETGCSVRTISLHKVHKPNCTVPWGGQGWAGSGPKNWCTPEMADPLKSPTSECQQEASSPKAAAVHGVFPILAIRLCMLLP